MVAKLCVPMQGRLQQLGSITVSITTTAVTQLLANARLTGGSLRTVCLACPLACCAPEKRESRVSLQLPSSWHHSPQNCKHATLHCLLCSLKYF